MENQPALGVIGHDSFVFQPSTDSAPKPAINWKRVDDGLARLLEAWIFILRAMLFAARQECFGTEQLVIQKISMGEITTVLQVDARIPRNVMICNT